METGFVVQATIDSNSLFLSSSILGVEIDFLLDTGSTLTVRHPDKFMGIAEKERPRLCRNNSQIRMANGDLLASYGEAILPLCIGDQVLQHTVVVADIEAPGILGLDFLKRHKGILDASNGILTIDSQRHKCMTGLEGSSVCRVQLKDTVVIPAQSEMIISGECRWPYGQNKNGLLEPSVSFLKRNLLMGKAVVDPHGDEIPVRVLNPTSDPFTLYKGTTLGTCEPEITVLESLEDRTPASGVDTCSALHSCMEVPSHLVTIWEGIEEKLSSSQQSALRELLIKFQHVFSKSKGDVGRTKLVQHKIVTGDAAPIKQHPRRIPQSLRPAAESELQRMLDQKIIEPSCSPWSSPIVLVKKKDGSLRFCVDYRKLNSVTAKDSYPIPRIDDSLDLLGGSQWFSTLDLASGYWQVELHPDDKGKTAFCTQGGLYQFNVMPFGLASAPATFERLMERVLSGLNWKVCLVYLDDIIVFSQSFEAHLQRIEEVLSRLQEAGLKISPSKCKLFQHEVDYLGHVVSRDGVGTDKRKIEAIAQWPQPQNVSEVRSFIGLCSYYRKFIKGFADIARPLHRLTEVDRPFIWTSECQSAFTNLKTALSSPPILGYPSADGKFILDTDASNFAIGAVLSQQQEGNERVIGYFSRCLSKPERKYCVTRKELLAVVESLKNFHHYLYGTSVLVRSDHGALRWLTNFKKPEGQMARWLEVLGTYNYEIEHRAGTSHKNADGLSRRPCSDCKHCDRKEVDVKEMVDCAVQATSEACIRVVDDTCHANSVLPSN